MMQVMIPVVARQQHLPFMGDTGNLWLSLVPNNHFAGFINTIFSILKLSDGVERRISWVRVSLYGRWHTRNNYWIPDITHMSCC
jgi:hypothetical protein